MDLNKKLDALNQLKEVDAPPFLYTRIQQQIQNLQHMEAPVKWKWTFALTAIMILFINIAILLRTAAPAIKKNTGVESVVNAMGLSTTNDLYHE
jgi:hypothetical protein